jgi:hypothetical protein
MLRCYRCHKEISLVSPFAAKHELCPYCSSALHCCLNCLYYDEFSPNKCSEPAADWVPDKAKANFCQFFEPTQPQMLKKQMDVDKAKAYWESLWKKAQ